MLAGKGNYDTKSAFLSRERRSAKQGAKPTLACNAAAFKTILNKDAGRATTFRQKATTSTYFLAKFRKCCYTTAAFVTLYIEQDDQPTN